MDCFLYGFVCDDWVACYFLSDRSEPARGSDLGVGLSNILDIDMAALAVLSGFFLNFVKNRHPPWLAGYGNPQLAHIASVSLFFGCVFMVFFCELFDGAGHDCGPSSGTGVQE